MKASKHQKNLTGSFLGGESDAGSVPDKNGGSRESAAAASEEEVHEMANVSESIEIAMDDTSNISKDHSQISMRFLFRTCTSDNDSSSASKYDLDDDEHLSLQEIHEDNVENDADLSLDVIESIEIPELDQEDVEHSERKVAIDFSTGVVSNVLDSRKPIDLSGGKVVDTNRPIDLSGGKGEDTSRPIDLSGGKDEDTSRPIDLSGGEYDNQGENLADNDAPVEVSEDSSSPVNVSKGRSSGSKQNGNRMMSFCRKFTPIAVICVVSAVLAFVAAYVWQRQEENLQTIDMDDPKDDWIVSNLKWGTSGRGLRVKIINSMSSDWHDLLEEVIGDWSAAPSLKLPMSEQESPDCAHMKGHIRVCNGEYGDTGWLGINEVIFYEYNGGQDSVIVSSVAMINENYFKEDYNPEKRRYVLCHEVGHGFGLPHRSSTGTCLITTTKQYSKNLTPDSIDFEMLESFYGVLNDEDSPARNMRGASHIIGEEIISKSHLDAQKGRLLYNSTHAEVYANELGDGLKSVSFFLKYVEE